MATNRHKFWHKGAAVSGVAVLGLLALPMAASAEPVDTAPWVVAPSTKGTLTVEKHVSDSTSTPGNPQGAPLEGIEMTITRVGTGTADNCIAIDLGTATGWDAWSIFQPLWAGQDPTNYGKLPNGYCAVTEKSERTVANGQAVFSNLALAPYLVVETDSGENFVEAMDAPFLVTVPLRTEAGQWDYSPVAYPKNTLNTAGIPTKTVGNNVAGSRI